MLKQIAPDLYRRHPAIRIRNAHLYYQNCCCPTRRIRADILLSGGP